MDIYRRGHSRRWLAAKLWAVSAAVCVLPVATGVAVLRVLGAL